MIFSGLFLLKPISFPVGRLVLLRRRVFRRRRRRRRRRRTSVGSVGVDRAEVGSEDSPGIR